MDWRFFVFCGKNVSGNCNLRELTFVPWVPEDIFFLIDTGLFHLRYFENGPQLEPGYYFCGSLKKSQKFPATRQPRSQGSLLPRERGWPHEQSIQNLAVQKGKDVTVT